MKIKLGSKRMVIKGNKVVAYAGLVVSFFILFFIFGDRKGPEIQGAKIFSCRWVGACRIRKELPYPTIDRVP